MGGGHNPGGLIAEEEGEGERRRRGEQEGREKAALALHMHMPRKGHVKTVRKQPSASQEESSRQKPNLPAL